MQKRFSKLSQDSIIELMQPDPETYKVKQELLSNLAQLNKSLRLYEDFTEKHRSFKKYLL